MGFLGNLFDKMLDSMDNDPTLKWNVLLKNQGVVDIKGKWASKEIFLNGKPIEKEKIASAIEIDIHKVNISWGGTEREDQMLAFAILFKFMSKEDASEYIDELCEDLVSELPKEDFDIEFGLLHWYNDVSGAFQRGKLSDQYSAADSMDDD